MKTSIYIVFSFLDALIVFLLLVSVLSFLANYGSWINYLMFTFILLGIRFTIVKTRILARLKKVSNELE